MKLPNGDSAVVELEKLTDYCLSRSHPRGRHKARVFFAALAITDQHAEELRAELLRAASEQDAIETRSDTFGTRYVLNFTWVRKERTALIRSVWIIRRDEIIPKFITCYLA